MENKEINFKTNYYGKLISIKSVGSLNCTVLHYHSYLRGQGLTEIF